MENPPYSNREIELLFKTIDSKLDGISSEIKATNKHFDARVKTLEGKVDRLESFQTKAMVVWAFFVTAVGFLLNRLPL
jgi:uncharacterized protein involved in tolerance to divalent cations